MNEADLLAKGFVRYPDGSYRKPGTTVNSLAGLRDPVVERGPVAAVARAVRSQARRTSSVDRGAHKRKLRVTITSFRRRILDGDNYEGSVGAKSLRDAIANSLGRDDAELKGTQWCYNQVVTKGPKGTLVQIEEI